MILNYVKDIVQGKTKLGCRRSSKWPSVRKAHLKNHPTCAVCGGTVKLEVHHIKSYSSHPELELNLDNLITLCESKSHGVVCHVFVGHRGNYKKINPDVVKDAAYWNKKLTQQ